jgi:hypothetical protein
MASKLKDFYNDLYEEKPVKSGLISKLIAQILFWSVSGKVNKAKQKLNNDPMLNYAIDDLKRASDKVKELIDKKYN